ncbi:unnamed protein product [Thelazia callipaeda]|uniref:G_PROTEIN_RECEP_F1_2 domain-containing protein n=1 Tax=Thelazia callipaeda TaxID=103827 RepID=A0A0N5DAX5_THECL|nr:unnamed protein product [Thelazia callipaeda]
MDEKKNATNELEVIEEYEKNLDCIYHPTQYLEERFWLVSVVGTTVATISIIENSFLFFVLITNTNKTKQIWFCSLLTIKQFFHPNEFTNLTLQQTSKLVAKSSILSLFKLESINKVHRQSYLLYFALLAFFDVLVAAAYISLMSISQLADYYMSPKLLQAWYFSKIKLPIKLLINELKSIKQNTACIGTLAEYTLELSTFALNPTYNELWRFWFRNIITILLPFFLLAFLNTRIVIVLHRKQYSSSACELSRSERKNIYFWLFCDLIQMCALLIFDNNLVHKTPKMVSF